MNGDAEAQCANFHQLALSGEVRLIPYYAVLLLPRVDQRLIDLSNKLDFVLICTPENGSHCPRLGQQHQPVH